jgi:site-specific DNA-methyltransferase (adenine-specific)
MYQLHHGDCLDILPTLESQSVDAVIADIPSGRTACSWDSVIPFAPMWKDLKRISKPRGAIVLLGCTQPFTSALVMSNVEWFRHHWIWHKTKATNYVKARSMPMRYHEDICTFASAGVRYFPQMRSGKPWKRIHRNGNKPDAIISDTRISGSVTERDTQFPSSVLFFPVEPVKAHPTQKPIALMEYLVKTYTNEGDTVLDFTMGSGTTGAACANTGRRFIGIEKDAGYFALASDRIAAAYDPLLSMRAAS